MQPATPSGPFSLTYDIRGAELAVAIPDGDLGALAEVMQQLSEIWNGPGTLLLVADEAGVLRSGIEDSLAALPPDAILLHPALTEAAREALRAQFPGRTAEWRRKALERELHWWWLVRDRDANPATVPAVASPADEDAALAAALWGWIDPDDFDTMAEQFIFEPVDRDDLAVTMLRAQIDGRCPVGWASLLTGSTECVNGPTQLALYVFGDPKCFDELVLFWNIRARYPRPAAASSVVGVTMEMVAAPVFGESIRDWAANATLGTKPDVRVWVTTGQIEAVRKTLTKAGMRFVDTGGTWTSYSMLPDERRDPEFAFAPLSIPMRLRRGQRMETLVGLREGLNPLRLAVPAEVPGAAGWRGLVHLTLQGLPLAFPLSDPLAAACLDNAIAMGRDSVAAAFGGSVHPLAIAVRLPPPAVQLEWHLASVGLRAETSAAGHIARALLGRLDGREDLDALAHVVAPSLLSGLVAPTRKKLAQYVRRELERAELGSVDEKTVVDLLKTEGLFAELETRTIDQLQGATSKPVDTLLSALGPLCEAGYLQRGRSLRCPLCRTPDFWRLAELDDRLRCRACRQEFPLPAVENGVEARTAYRLDGLTARAMSQDLLPVLLTLRHLLGRPETRPGAHWWPGLDLYESGSDTPDDEIDLLVADGGNLRVCEVKARAPGITVDTVTELIATAKRLGGDPVIAALEGEWRADVVELLDHDDFLLLGPGELLAPS
jgi:hypothetical protein